MINLKSSPLKIYQSFGRHGLYFRATDAILDIILHSSNAGDSVALPVFTCVTSIVDALKGHNRNIVWMDINIEKNCFVSIAEIERVSKSVSVVILHSYWGNEISSIHEIYKLVESNNCTLIIDYAHRFEVDNLLNIEETMKAKEKLYIVYSLSKEIPYLLGGLCVPKIRDNKLSWSLYLSMRAVAAYFSMKFSSSNNSFAMFLKFLRLILGERKSNIGGNDIKLLPRRMTLLQFIFIPFQIMGIRKARIQRKNLIFKMGLGKLDEHIWAKLFDISENNKFGFREVEMWPAFQSYEQVQFTNGLRKLIDQNTLYRIIIR